MKSVFNHDGYIMRVLTDIKYIVSLNFLLLLSAVPIVTVGAGMTAMYSVMFEYLKGEDPKILKTFMRAFRENSKKATLIWGVLFFIGVTLIKNYHFLSLHEIYGKFFLYIILSAVMILWIVLILYLFPVIAYFQNDLKGYIVFVLGLSVAKLPYTGMLVFLNVLPIGFFLYFAEYVPIVGVFFLCGGISLPAYYSCKIYLKLFNGCGWAENNIESNKYL